MGIEPGTSRWVVGASAVSCRTNEEELQRSQRQRQQDGDTDMGEEIPGGGEGNRQPYGCAT